MGFRAGVADWLQTLVLLNFFLWQVLFLSFLCVQIPSILQKTDN